MVSNGRCVAKEGVVSDGWGVTVEGVVSDVRGLTKEGVVIEGRGEANRIAGKLADIGRVGWECAEKRGDCDASETLGL